MHSAPRGASETAAAATSKPLTDPAALASRTSPTGVAARLGDAPDERLCRLLPYL